MDGVGCAFVSVVLTLTVHENPWGIAAAWVHPASLGQGLRCQRSLERPRSLLCSQSRGPLIDVTVKYC